ncbi:SDR family NAD(P)-dependent oxidoreductase [Endozoicomonas sp. G2_2]|uniref:SDR family NAD(P)-dependent oxidoreductase n=1 Tax=Endozoicomonas sp. G2_2 TaxID=2821092 RepID=UPI001ADB15B7|nr:SDR family NAD(P)-dependent oxidoreductase [Endozoicomonas sp. G2_2]MBO9470195.1 SDR family NAD(P)-dependent oxidoreductase [Endozoicomonas sp. G2_2]
MTDSDSSRPLADRVILITGAGGGIGASVARAIAAAGAECVLIGRRERTLTPVFDAIVADGSPEPALFPLDVTKAGEDDYQRLVDGIAADCGGLHGVVHLAARFDGLMPLATHAIDGWQRIMHINLTAAFALTQVCLPLLQAAEDASVVFTVDQAAAQPKAFWGAYGVSKAGLAALVRLFAVEHEQNPRLRFNAIDPGPRDTGLRSAAFPADDPAARPVDELGAHYVKLLSGASRGTTGRIFGVDGTSTAA